MVAKKAVSDLDTSKPPYSMMCTYRMYLDPFLVSSVLRASKMTHGIRMQVTKLDNLSLILRTHMGQRKPTPDICPPTSTSSSRTHATYLIETK